MILFFYLFATLIILSSIMVVTNKNSMHSILWLIFAFCNASGLMILLGAEFIAMMLIIIYVGAVAILFLFIIMMLDINLAKLKNKLKRPSLLGLFAGVMMFADLVLIIMLGTKSIHPTLHQRFIIPAGINNVEAIGRVLYTDFILEFQIAGLILFTAMIACISLTLRVRTGVKRQNISKQLARNKNNSLQVLEITPNDGVKKIKYNE